MSQLPMLPDSYRRCIISGNYSALGGVSAENISIMTNWSDVDEQMLKVLNERLSVQDPTEHARQKLALRTSVIQIITKLEQTARAFSVSGIDTIRALRADARTKRIAAQESQKIKDGSLEGVGTSTWRAMWEAARIYSQLPYPDVAFPVTAGASCLLCNQELSAEAQQRLVNFEAFVQSRIEIEANAAEDYYVRALSNLMVSPSTSEIATLCAGAALPDQWKEYLSSIWTLASASRQSLIEHEAIQNAQPIPDLSDAITKLIVYRDKLQGEADQFQKDAAGFDKAKAILDKNEAEARKWVASQKESIEAESVRLRRYDDYDKWIGFTNSRFISLKSTDVTQKVVTDAYAARFNQELRALGAGTIQVELVKIRTENAKVLHQLQLIGVQRDKPHNVLSEGERRIISLAAFLADVSDRPGSAPFIFDDPISSLDHDFEWHVAKRLVELAKSRQVIILTHRLSLFGVIEDLAKKRRRCVEKTASSLYMYRILQRCRRPTS
ncbi:AAA family ATPase [Morganella psychrotolerans]|uniref:AAA family ATPase n=1 Tax=Morganella psychrotolerans TaxID=368603 RepID=UPI001F2FFDFA|nr:AAA family ATPase [Morganella psychrotolerans]